MPTRREDIHGSEDGGAHSRGESPDAVAPENWYRLERVTAAERWTVGVTAHHLAGGGGGGRIVTGIVSGGPSRGNSLSISLYETAQACEGARRLHAETLALFQKGAATRPRGRLAEDYQLSKSGTVFTDVPPDPSVSSCWACSATSRHMGSIRKPSACYTNRPRGASPFTRLCCVDRRRWNSGRPG